MPEYGGNAEFYGNRDFYIFLYKSPLTDTGFSDKFISEENIFGKTLERV